MKQSIQANILFMRGHIEVLLENPKGQLVLHIRKPEDIEGIKRYKEKNTVKEEPCTGYIWDGERLIFRQSSQPDIDIPINDPKLFEKKLKVLQGEQPVCLDLFLGLEQVHDLITANGGHVPDAYQSTFYSIDRWSEPEKEGFIPEGKQFYKKEEDTYRSSCRYTSVFSSCRKFATETYSFNIEADPADIVRQWEQYFYRTNPTASLLGNNCAVAAQWFLSNFAGVETPHFWNAPFSNDLIVASRSKPAVAVYLPSVLPIPVTVPKRIFEHAKFQKEIQKAPQALAQQDSLKLSMVLAKDALLVMGNLAGLYLAQKHLGSGLNYAATALLIAAVVKKTVPNFFASANNYAAHIQANKVLESKTGKEVSSELSLV